MNISDMTEMINKYGSYVWSFCIHLSNDTYEAEELYQDTFLKAIEKVAQIDKDNNPRSYLCFIALSLHKSRKRKSARRHLIAPQSSLEDESILPHSDNTENIIIQQDEKSRINSIINSLEEKYKIPVLLHYMADMPLDDIAKIVKCPKGTVKSRLHTARKLIKDQLEVQKIEY